MSQGNPDRDHRWDTPEQRAHSGRVEGVNPEPADPSATKQVVDPDDPADAHVDPQVLRDGGPTRFGGALTTTGGTAGPASVRRIARRGRNVAPTTTGSAETGGMSTPVPGHTSDASGPAPASGLFTDD